MRSADGKTRLAAQRQWRYLLKDIAATRGLLASATAIEQRTLPDGTTQTRTLSARTLLARNQEHQDASPEDHHPSFTFHRPRNDAYDPAPSLDDPSPTSPNRLSPDPDPSNHPTH